MPPERRVRSGGQVLVHQPADFDGADLVLQTTKQLIYRGRTEGWLVAASLEPDQ